MNSSQIKMRRLLHPNRVAVRTNNSRAAALLDFFAYHPRTSRLRHTKQSTCAKLWLTTFAPCKVPTYWWLKRQHRLSVLPVFPRLVTLPAFIPHQFITKERACKPAVGCRTLRFLRVRV